MPDVMRCRTICPFAAVLTLSVGILVAGEPQTPSVEPRVFESEEGGFRVDVPAAWNVKEVPGAESYQGFFSREKVEKEGDLYTYGLSVLRLRDYRNSFTFKASTPADIAMEYATMVASKLAGGAGGTVIGLPTGDHGLKLTKYVVIGGKGPDCVTGTLLIGIKGKQWFHALWETPCSEMKEPVAGGTTPRVSARTSEIFAMVRSLQVKSKWGSERR